ncbi:hypothetical protein HK100_009638 [Physocladia obscura]|uniref:Uncharacterized protein n=1 Tax=Physocladia obscura TaxID=109957 RepID=A0AAD5TBN5_9FUNG|nr:hypothetical protein HK100_009638 [Physocladia obscura]
MERHDDADEISLLAQKISLVFDFTGCFISKNSSATDVSLVTAIVGLVSEQLIETLSANDPLNWIHAPLTFKTILYGGGGGSFSGSKDSGIDLTAGEIITNNVEFFCMIDRGRIVAAVLGNIKQKLQEYLSKKRIKQQRQTKSAVAVFMAKPGLQRECRELERGVWSAQGAEDALIKTKLEDFEENSIESFIINDASKLVTNLQSIQTKLPAAFIRETQLMKDFVSFMCSQVLPLSIKLRQSKIKDVVVQDRLLKLNPLPKITSFDNCYNGK